MLHCPRRQATPSPPDGWRVRPRLVLKPGPAPPAGWIGIDSRDCAVSPRPLSYRRRPAPVPELRTGWHIALRGQQKSADTSGRSGSLGRPLCAAYCVSSWAAHRRASPPVPGPVRPQRRTAWPACGVRPVDTRCPRPKSSRTPSPGGSATPDPDHRGPACAPSSRTPAGCSRGPMRRRSSGGAAGARGRLPRSAGGPAPTAVRARLRQRLQYCGLASALRPVQVVWRGSGRSCRTGDEPPTPIQSLSAGSEDGSGSMSS